MGAGVVACCNVLPAWGKHNYNAPHSGLRARLQSSIQGGKWRSTMAKPADNDNIVRLNQSGAAEAGEWTAMSSGNTALATSTYVEAGDQPLQQSSTTPPPVPTASSPPALLHDYVVSDAATLDDLGLRIPKRPLPGTAGRRDGAFAVRQGQHFAEDAAQRRSGARQQPPDAHEHRQPAGRAAAAPPAADRIPVTGQPGFLFGLIAAAASGAGLYLYLV